MFPFFAKPASIVKSATNCQNRCRGVLTSWYFSPVRICKEVTSRTAYVNFYCDQKQTHDRSATSVSLSVNRYDPHRPGISRLGKLDEQVSASSGYGSTNIRSWISCSCLWGAITSILFCPRHYISLVRYSEICQPTRKYVGGLPGGLVYLIEIVVFWNGVYRLVSFKLSMLVMIGLSIFFFFFN